MQPNTVSEINANDLVIFKEGKNIMSGGYKINSLFLNNNISPMENNNCQTQHGGNVSSIFSNLAVPAGLLLLQQNTTKKSLTTLRTKGQVISEDLHDKLLNHTHKHNKVHHNRKTKINKKMIKNKNTNKTKRRR
jgi:hypothetical protein